MDEAGCGKLEREIFIGKTRVGDHVIVHIGKDKLVVLQVGENGIIMPNLATAMIGGMNWVVGRMDWCAATPTPSFSSITADFVSDH